MSSRRNRVLTSSLTFSKKSHHLPILEIYFAFTVSYSKIFNSEFRTIMPLPRSIFNPSLYARIHDLWFPNLSPTSSVGTEAQTQRWFPRDPDVRAAVDQLCKKELEEPLLAIGPNKEVSIDSLKRDLEDEVLVFTCAPNIFLLVLLKYGRIAKTKSNNHKRRYHS
jgi:hypothetical protein